MLVSGRQDMDTLQLFMDSRKRCTSGLVPQPVRPAFPTEVVLRQQQPSGRAMELQSHHTGMQVPARDFFVKTLFLFDGGEDVGMVLSPQVPLN